VSRRVSLRISGMTCGHCAEAVRRALEQLPGVRAEVSFRQGRADVEVPEDVPDAELVAVVEGAGYGAEVAAPLSRVGEAGDALHIAVVGSGAAAFACTLAAAERGARVTMIEAGTLGGTCVNVGCVPSKAALAAAHAAHTMAAHPFEGIERARPRVDAARLAGQRRALVEALRRTKYAEVLEATEGAELLRGRARFLGPRRLEVTRPDGSRVEMEPDRVLVATGARPAVPSIPGLEGTPYWTSTEALAAEWVPERLVVLGGSAVGLELGQMFARLGARVTVVELEPRLLPREDPELGEGLRLALEAEGIRVLTGAGARAVRHDGVRFEIEVGGGAVEAEALLVATGRRPATEGLGLEAAGVATAPDGAIEVDDRLRTSAEHVWAAGDCTTLPRLVYVAAAAGTRAAINMTGGDARLDLRVLPVVVFTDPQAAWVGLDEAAARAGGHEVEVRRLDLDRVPRALASRDTRGFVKLVAEAGTGRLLGAQLVAAGAGEAVQAAALAISAGMTVHDLAAHLFPYLTMVEGLRLAAQAFTRDVSRLSCCAG